MKGSADEPSATNTSSGQSVSAPVNIRPPRNCQMAAVRTAAKVIRPAATQKGGAVCNASACTMNVPPQTKPRVRIMIQLRAVMSGSGVIGAFPEQKTPAPGRGQSQTLRCGPKDQFLDLSTILPAEIHGIMPRSVSPTASIWCASLLRRIALKLG